VILSGRRADVIQSAAKKIRGAVGMPLDISKEAEVAAAHAMIEKEHGVVDILVNSAGGNIPNRKFSELSPESWRMMIDMNLNGAFFSARIVLPGMRKKKGGLIINIASIFGAGAVVPQKKLNFVVTLKDWHEVENVDRIGLDRETYEILGIKVPHVTLPVRIGRDIARLVEVAALDQKLKDMGENSAQEFNQKLLHMISERRNR